MNECKLVAMLVTIVAINTVLLAGIVYKGNEYYKHIRHQTEPIRQIGAVLNGDAPPEPLEQHLGMLLGDVVGDFFFGTFDGSIAAFAQNMMTTDFAKIGADFTALANSVEAVFDGTDCGTRTCDHANQKIDCGGRRRYCTAKGEVIRCDDAGPCFGPAIAQGAAAVRSVSDKIATVKTITTTATAPAAFSNGIFRMDAVMSWLDGQSNWAGWESASQVVSNFVANIRRVDFSGCARDTDQWGFPHENCWNINSGVTSVMDALNQVSSPIKPPEPVPLPKPLLKMPHSLLGIDADEMPAAADANSEIEPPGTGGEQSDGHPNPSHSNKHRVVAAVGATLSGVVIGALVTVSVLIALRRRRTNAKTSQPLEQLLPKTDEREE